MDKNSLQRCLSYIFLSDFFAGFSLWEKTNAALSPLLGEKWGLQEAAHFAAQEYDELFKGCNAGIYIPLWASACAGKGDILFDETTLDVIKFYYKHGYKPADMDGNPPDFIGQKLMFLAYLSASGIQTGESEAEKEFIEKYLAPAAAAISHGVKKHARHGVFLSVINFLSDLTASGKPRGLPRGDWNEGQISLAKNFLSSYRNKQVIRAYLRGKEPAVTLGEAKIVKSAGRNNCGGKCPLQAQTQEGCVLSVRAGDKKNFPKIIPCIRGTAYRQNYLTGKRLRYPMKRIGERGEGRFKRISWEEASELVAGEFTRVKNAYGPASRYVNYSWGVNAVLRPHLFAMRLLNLDGGFLDYYNSYSTACTHYVTPFIYGDIASGNSIPDMLNTKLLILWGHNPAETVFGSERMYYLKKAKEIGIRIVVIDPRYSDTAKNFADEWIGIKPSTDGALADAMAYVIWRERLYNKSFMDKYCAGFDEDHLPAGAPIGGSYESYLFGKSDPLEKTPQWASAITGISAQTITKLARDYANAKPACILPGYGIQRIANGEQTVRGIAMLAALTGNIGIPGGGAGGSGAVIEHAKPVFPLPPNPVSAKIPSFLWTQAVERGASFNKTEYGLVGAEKLESNIKLIVNFAGNILINQQSDINETIRILRDTNKCEFILVSDVFMNASAKFADILLPAASLLESPNIAGPWSYGSYLLYADKVIEPFFACRFEYDFMRDVARRLGHLEKFDEGRESCEAWLEDCYNNIRPIERELPEYGVFKKSGGYQFKTGKPYIAYKKQIENPARFPFATPCGKIEIFSQRLFEMNRPHDIPALPKYTPCPEGPADPLVKKYPLQLTGWHTKRSTHSVHYGSGYLEKHEPHRLWIHPLDAASRNIADGDTVEVFNARGRARIKAAVTERVIEGVVAMPQGAWYSPDKNGVDTGGSINVLTAQRPTPLAKGNGQHTNLVEVKRAAKEF